MSEARVVACPNCGASVVWSVQSQFRPFCSERCRQIDLGVWASGGYCVPGESEDAEAELSAETLPSKPHE